MMSFLRLPLLFGGAFSWSDCEGETDWQPGPFAPTQTFKDLVAETDPPLDPYKGPRPIHAMLPAGDGPFPVLVFLHGMGVMYNPYMSNFEVYATHGFAVIMPYVKGDPGDHATTDPNGWAIDRGVLFAREATANASSPLFGKLDVANVVIAGHSMGAWASIMAAERTGPGELKAVISQHPSVCGPYGPPPRILNSTWNNDDLARAVNKFPTLLMTATNDNIFFKNTAGRIYKCYESMWEEKTRDHLDPERSYPTAIIEFSNATDACGGEISGHLCPIQKPTVENPWLLRMAKLYAQLGGDASTKCHALLWGSTPASLRNDPLVARTDIRYREQGTVV